MNTVFIALGSNLGDRAENLSSALGAIVSEGLILKQLSQIYETAPWGFESETTFLNQVVEVQTQLLPAELLVLLLDIEQQLGRSRDPEAVTQQPYQSRSIDLDILLYNSSIHHMDHLIIPHPKLHLRKFVLEPLTELAPDHVHPLLGITITELLSNTPDQGAVSVFQPVTALADSSPSAC